MKAEDPEASEEIEPQSHHIDLEKLENARYTNEMALLKWQALIVLENEAGAYRTIPLPYILSREVQSLASLNGIAHFNINILRARRNFVTSE